MATDTSTTQAPETSDELPSLMDYFIGFLGWVADHPPLAYGFLIFTAVWGLVGIARAIRSLGMRQAASDTAWEIIWWVVVIGVPVAAIVVWALVRHHYCGEWPLPCGEPSAPK